MGEEQEFERVGGNRTIQTDVRIIAATNRDLKGAVEEQKLRADLYYLLAVFPVRVPPLRERLGDIPLLIRTSSRNTRCARVAISKPSRGPPWRR